MQDTTSCRNTDKSKQYDASFGSEEDSWVRLVRANRHFKWPIIVMSAIGFLILLLISLFDAR